MKILSKDLYKKIRENLATELSARGYKRTRDGMLGWYKPLKSEYILFWFQCDKWGWDEDWGSSFTIEFQVSNSTKIAYGNVLKRNRVPYMLIDSDLEIMRKENNQVIESTNGYKNKLQMYAYDDNEKILIIGKDTSKTSYDKNHDHWFEYYTYQDIDFWSSYFIERLDYLINYMEEAKEGTMFGN